MRRCERPTKSMENRKPNILKGAVAGLIGGIIGTAAKSAAEAIYPPRIHGEPEPPVELAEKLAGHHLAPASRTAASESIHWGFGMLAGAFYGMAAEYYPPATAKGGATFGLTLCTITHEGVLPAMHLAASPEEQQPREQHSELATHIVYGVVTESVRSVVRRIL